MDFKKIKILQKEQSQKKIFFEMFLFKIGLD